MKGFDFMKIKAMICSFGAICAALCISSAVYAQSEISVMVDNNAVAFDQQPVILNDRTLVPIRAVFEQAGASVSWNGDTHTATIEGKGHTVHIGVGNDYMIKDGKTISLDVPATVINDRTLIPVRAISEAMDYAVTWDGYHRTVLVATDNKPYRAFVGINRGFRSLEDVSEYYIDRECSNLSVDLDDDGVLEVIDFISTPNLLGAGAGALLIDGIDYTEELSMSMSGIGAIAVVSPSVTSQKMLVIIENSDIKVAHFYTFNGTVLTPVKDLSGANSSIMFKKNLMFDEKKYAISDLYGICCTDIMVTGSYFQFDQNTMGFYRLSTVKDIIPRTLVVSHNDDMLFGQIITQSYFPGTYKEIASFDLINTSQLTSFTLLDMYVDKNDPSYIEFYIQTESGETFVLMPYCV